MVDDLTKFQIDPKFAPDKASEWKTSPEEDTWVLSHESLRGELAEIEKVLVNVVDDPITWKIQALKSMWNYHCDHVLAHHRAEENVMKPVLETRFQYPEKASAGHKHLEENVNALSQLLEDAKEKDTMYSFQSMFQQYATELRQHFKDEEEMVLPLLRAYFTQVEFKETGKRMGKEGGHAGSFVYYIGEERFRNELMVKWGMPFFIWYIAFAPALKEYRLQVIVPGECIVANIPPTDQSSCKVS